MCEQCAGEWQLKTDVAKSARTCGTPGMLLLGKMTEPPQAEELVGRDNSNSMRVLTKLALNGLLHTRSIIYIFLWVN